MTKERWWGSQQGPLFALKKAEHGAAQHELGNKGTAASNPRTKNIKLFLDLLGSSRG
jgi:hypothetical protein